MPPNQIWTQERIPRRDGTVANEMVEASGPESFHQDDYSIFYNNVKDNVAKRIAAYLLEIGMTSEEIDTLKTRLSTDIR